MKSYYPYDDIVNGNTLLLTLFTIFSLYMLYGSFSFESTRTRLFPQLFSILLLLMVFIYVGKSIIDVETDSSIISQDKIKKGSDYDEKDIDEFSSRVNRPISDLTFTTTSIALYSILSYLISILWASPLFVGVYCLWYRKKLTTTITLSMLSIFMIAILAHLTNVPLDEGIIIDRVI